MDRSTNMRAIRSKNMKPELAVRGLVHRLGYRFRLHRKDLAAGTIVPLRAALPFPRLLLLLPDRVHTPRNTSAISL